jgi:hypothetical protein
LAFCPNCGNKEADTAAACSKCNTPLAGSGAPASTKFKGTIMMGGASASEVEAMVQKAKAAAQAGQAARAGTGSSPAAPSPAATAPAAAPPDDRLAYQATIMGPITKPGEKAADPAAPAFAHPLGAGGAEEAADDALHHAPTMAFDPASRGPAPEGGATMVDPGPPEGMGGFTDERVSAPVKPAGGGGGKMIFIVILILLVLVGGGIGLYFAFRTPEVPMYPGYPVPGQPVVPGQIPGYPMPGQVPGVPGVPPAQ